MNHYIMKNGTLIPYDTSYIICMFTQCLLSNKSGEVIFALEDEIEDYKEKHLQFFKEDKDEKSTESIG